MGFLIAIAVVLGLVWGTIFLLRGSLVTGCLLAMLAACCFGHTFLEFDAAGLPLTLDRLAIALVVAAYFIQRQIGRADPKPLYYVDGALLGFAGLLVISTFTSDWRVSKPGEISATWRLLFGYLMPLSLYWVARQSPINSGRVRLAMGSLAGFGVYLAITGLAEISQQWWLVFPQYIADPKIGIHFGRARGPMVQAACYGTCLAICMLALWTWQGMIRSQSRERTAGSRGRSHQSDFGSRAGMLLVLLLMPLFCAAIYFTYTRSAWLEAAVGLMIVLAFMLRGAWRNAVLGTMIAAGLLVGVTKWESLVGFQREQSATDTRKSAQMRGSFAYVSWQMFLDRPILGCGFGQYRKEVLPYLADRSTELDLESIRGYVHHNTLLCILVENGALGMLLFLAVLAGWGRAAWQLVRRRESPEWARPLGVLMLATLVTYLIQTLSRDVTYTAVENMLVFFLAGLTVGVRQAFVAPEAARQLGASPRWAGADRRFALRPFPHPPS